MKIHLILPGAAVASILTVTALPHSAASGVVKDRMEAMRDTVKTVTPMMDGTAAYASRVVRAAARVTKTRPEIWTDWVLRRADRIWPGYPSPAWA